VVLVLLAAGFIVRRGRPRRRTPHAIRDHRDPHP
jgi:hypothetical protein